MQKGFQKNNRSTRTRFLWAMRVAIGVAAIAANALALPAPENLSFSELNSNITPAILTLTTLAHSPIKSNAELYRKMIRELLETNPHSPGEKDHAYLGDGRTALHQAAANGDNELIELFLQKGIDVNTQNAVGETPLHFAVRMKHFDSVDLLLRHHAEVNEQTRFTHETPLMFAASTGQENMVALLEKSGANPSLKDVFGKTAKDRFVESILK